MFHVPLKTKFDILKIHVALGRDEAHRCVTSEACGPPCFYLYTVDQADAAATALILGYTRDDGDRSHSHSHLWTF